MVSKQRKITPNRYTPDTAAKTSAHTKKARIKKISKTIAVTVMIITMSLTAILIHDAVVQSPFFTIQTVDIIGINRVSRDVILAKAGLNRTRNLFEIRPTQIEMKLASLPWIASAHVKRRLFSGVTIEVEEQAPLAIVTIENLADLVINTQGIPFKEYEPEKDRLDTLPVITGMDLTLSDKVYQFEGPLFNSVMEMLKVKGLGTIRSIHGDPHTGILIQAADTNVSDTRTKDSEALAQTGSKDVEEQPQGGLIPIKLGFDRFEEKLAKAADIRKYMAVCFPDKTILAMDLFDMDRVFITATGRPSL
ncbi:MAG: TetR family transcriptional regulator [Desulfobacterales bacterium]|nr:MAG: TetR family transcriptional regulator [Desulfobacterales bacterium]